MSGLHWITPDQPAHAFPPADQALRDPDGLLAIGGDLTRERLLSAYRNGIFPWFNPGQPVLWWSPDPRAVMFPTELHISRSLRRRLKSQPFEFSIDTDFAGVMRACAHTRRRGQHGTWITDDMLAAYCDLHDAGYAHCVEARHGNALVGGIYGIALGRVFFGESMFSVAPDASKAALVVLVRELLARGFMLLDCQVASAHLAALGSRNIPRHEFLQLLDTHVAASDPQRWRLSVETQDLHVFNPAVDAVA